ncbi:hypothetical protein [Sphingobacterium sp.]|uniref:hypothetical protein n=1 Tax=Sphingobacterium sp. TaxID=341027 RepID=UPI002FD9D6FD
MNNLKNNNDTNNNDGGTSDRVSKRFKQTIEEKKAKKRLLNTKYYFAVTKLKRKLQRIEKLNNKVNEK